MHKSSSPFALVALSAALLASLLAAGPAEAGRQRHTTVTGANGKTATRDVSRNQGDVQSSTTGPNGKTSSRTVDRSPGQTTATVTGPNGQTASRTTTRSGSASSPQP